MKKTFAVELIVDMELSIDQKVFDQVDEEWIKRFYPLHTEEKVVEMIAYNYLINNTKLSWLDGFASLSDDLVDYEYCEAENVNVYWAEDDEEEK